MANRKDVSLVIRARDEAGKAFQTATAALEGLLGANQQVGASASKTGNRLQELAEAALAFDKTALKIFGSADNAASAFDRMGKAVADSKAQLASLQAQADGAQRAKAQLQQQIVDTVSAGGDQAPLVAQLKLVEREYDRLIGTQSKLSASIAAQESALNGQRNSLQQVGSTANAAEDARERLAAAIELENTALRENEALSKRAATAQAAFNAKFAPGLTRDSTGNASRSAEVLAEAAAHDSLIQKLRLEEAAEAELARSKEARARASTLLPGSTATGSSARASAAVFLADDEAKARRLGEAIGIAATETKRMDGAAARLRAELNPLAAIEDRLSKEQAELNALFKAGKISASELSGGLALLRANADRTKLALNGANGVGFNGRPALFGLRPHELTNLSYQVNDVFTQLASGTSAMQTLGQQGGQLIQIFPRVGSAIFKGFTSAPVLTLTAAVGGAILALKEAGDQAETLRTFEGALTATADGAAYQAQALSKASTELDRYGLSAAEAVKIVRAFVSEGLNPDAIERFGRSAKDMADMLGIDVADAAKQVATAFSAGFDAIKKLDEATGFLTSAEREHIRTMFDEGHAAEARTAAFEIFERKQDQAADKMRGPWSEAVLSFSNAWDHLLKRLSDTAPIKGASKLLRELAKEIELGAEQLSGIRTIDGIEREMQQVRARLSVDEATNFFGVNDKFIAKSKARLAELKSDWDKVAAARKGAMADTRLAESEDQKDADAELERQEQRRLASEKKLSAEARVRLAMAEAQRAAETAGASDRGAQLAADRAGARERRQIEREITEERKRQATAAKAARDQAKRTAAEQRRGYIADIDDNGRENLLSTARRFQGFSEKNGSQRAELQSFFRAAGITLDPAMLAWCAAFINAVLGANKLPQTGSNMARSFLNYGSKTSDPKEGDIVVSKRGKNPAEGHVGFFVGFDAKGNVKVLSGNTSDKVGTQTVPRDDVLGFRRPPGTAEVYAEQAKAEDSRLKKQSDFNAAIDAENIKRGQTVSLILQQQGLTGVALIEAQKRQFIEEAVAAQRAKAAKDELAYTAQQEATTRILAAQEFELTRGVKERAAARQEELNKAREAVDRPIVDLSAQRSELQSQMEFLRESGNIGLADALLPQLGEVNARLLEAILKAREFYAALNPEQMEGLKLTAGEVESIRLRLENTALSAQRVGQILGVSLPQIAQQFASGAVNAFDQLAQAVGQGENVFRSLRQAVLQLASDFLSQIAKMIQQQIVFNIVSRALSAIGGAAGGAGGSAGNWYTGQFHDGGIVGEGGTRRAASPLWFAKAMRYHTGGVVGLRPNEVPAILERGEEVLTANDPRHRDNGGGGMPVVNLKNINVIDPADVLEKAISTRVGEKVMLNWMAANSAAVRGAIG